MQPGPPSDGAFAKVCAEGVAAPRAVESRPGSGSGTGGAPPSPIFIMGCPRSGTTLLAQILNCHSRISIYHETYYYPVFHGELAHYGDLRRQENLERFLADLFEHLRIQRVEPPDPEEFRRALVAPTFPGVLHTLLHLYARRQSKLRSGDKTPGHHAHVARLREDFPESPMLFLLRDPRDTVLSMQRVFRTSVKGAAARWNRAFQDYVRSSPSIHAVRFEELVRDPERVLQTVCGHLGERFEPAMLQYYEHVPPEFLDRRHAGRLRGPIDASSVGNYRELPARHVALIEEICAEGMEALGYERTTPRRAPTPAPPEPASGRLRFVVDQLRYYGFHRERWKRGWFRWRMSLRLRLRSLLHSDGGAPPAAS